MTPSTAQLKQEIEAEIIDLANTMRGSGRTYDPAKLPKVAMDNVYKKYGMATSQVAPEGVLVEIPVSKLSK